ncbi:hypothetical protein QA646_29955 (plasmid) [Rhizobium sp. CB3090]|uniref:hypothetical protein n=1 Tax=Rhizobium sp. CB3090 TaxID=3039156 RepID=UPI0024B0CFE3|nr:hypothetical protein [Rhizobium sp. CB3090]WFU13422.1 hypothetical protein QA646_29955 [Rhizobium sp. CB3090]
MTRLNIIFAAALAFGASAGAAVAQDESCPREGGDAPLTLHADWIMKGWERKEGDPNFVFSQKLSRYYDLESTKGVFYDNFAPGDTQLFRDPARYGANWEALQNATRSVHHGLTGGQDAIVGDTVASTTLGFAGRIDRLDGKIIAFDGRSQLGWECTGGKWKIRHELNYAWIVKPESIERFLGRTGTQQ